MKILELPSLYKAVEEENVVVDNRLRIDLLGFRFQRCGVGVDVGLLGVRGVWGKIIGQIA